jgi:hypothetical protein
LLKTPENNKNERDCFPDPGAILEKSFLWEHVMSNQKKPGRGRIYSSITETIGDTPLVRLDRLAAKEGVKANLLVPSSSSSTRFPRSRTVSASP